MANKPYDALEEYKQLKSDMLKIDKQDSAEIGKLKAQIEAELERKREKASLELARKIADLEEKGIRVNAKLRLQLIEKEIKDEESRRRKAQIELLKEQSKATKKAEDRERKNEERTLKVLNKLSNTDENGNDKSFIQRAGDKLSILGDALKGTITNLGKTFREVGKQISNAVNNAMTQYAQYQTGINARLQSTGKNFASIEKSLGQVAYSPLLKATDLYSNLAKLVEDGIVSNVEQRAFLMTIKDNIATTFDANTNAIKRIIRIQQEDSTASRLGLEAFLTRYMNQLVQNTEYLTTTFDNVQEALLEASSLMNMSQSTAFEYQVQKWLSAMTGLGVSESTSSSLAQALGYLGSGNIEALGSSSLQNLLVMASARAGISYADMLKGGLGSETTNTLLASIVNFVQDIYDNSKDNNVVLSQLSNTFGLTVSDVRSIANMSESIKNSLVGSSMTNAEMYSELGYQFNKMGSRMSIATLLENAFSNFEYQTGATLASSPISYALWKIADFIGSTTSGINIPSAYVVGTGVDLNTTIDNMLKLGLVGYSTLSNIEGIASAVKSGFSGSSLLSAMGINQGSASLQKGTGLSVTQSGLSTSSLAYMTSSNQAAYSESANMMKEQQKAEAQENTRQEGQIELKDINVTLIDNHSDLINHLKDIIQILRYESLSVKLDNTFTGLTS